MKKLFASLLILLAYIGNALALSDSAIPTKVPTTWAQSAPPGNSTCPIPIPSQISITAGRASWTDGFPPLTFLPLGSGGVPPFGADFNGVLCQLSQWTRWSNAGGPVQYDGTFQSAIGGYPNAAVIGSATNPYHFWISLVDNNNSNPDTGGANWQDMYLASAASLWAGTAGGTANALTISITGWTSNVVGPQLQFIPANANTGAATLAVSGLPAQVIKRKTPGGLIALTGGELQPLQIATVTWDGTQFELTSPTIVKSNLVLITATGTYTPSAGIVSGKVTCIGGGGGGGGAVATAVGSTSVGGGGGGGGIATGIYPASQLLPNVSVTIGAGGTVGPGNPGGTGGSTLFGSLINVSGGVGGSVATAGTLSSQATGIAGGGTAGGGQIRAGGALGLTGMVINQTNNILVISGSGGNGLLGGQGGGGQSINTGGFSGLSAGLGFGAGGGGAGNSSNQASNLSGGAGLPGACMVEELIAQ